MIEAFGTHIALILLLAPLGLVGIWRWSVYLFKASQAKKYRPLPIHASAHPGEVSVVVPVYNEDPQFFKQGLASWANEYPGVIILVIDHSDSACIETAQEFKRLSPVPVEIVVTTRTGKREALVDGISLVTTPFVVLVDSDTVFESGVLKTLLSPFFVDERIGGTAPRQMVWEPRTLTQLVYSIQIEERYNVEMPFLDVGGLTTTCISGRTAMYRMDAVYDKLSELEEEYFWGTRCVSGDDKCLTRIVQRNGWLVKYQHQARVWTHAVPDLLTYLKQRVRWTRNTWRSDLTALTNEGGWVYRNKYLAFHMIDRFIQPFTLIIGPIFFITALISGFYVVAGLFVVWIVTTRLLKLSTHIARRPKLLIVLLPYIVVTYVIAVLKIYALFTIRKQGWITRWSSRRLAKGMDFLRRVTSKYLPTAATVGVVLLIAHGLNLFYETTIAAVMENEGYSIRQVTHEEALAAAEDLEQMIRNPEVDATHVVDPGETLLSIARRYNVLPSEITGYTGEEVVAGDVLSIPIAALRTPNSIKELSTRPSSTIEYIPFSKRGDGWEIENLQSENVVVLSGVNTAISIEEVVEVLQARYGSQVVENLGNGEWLLKSSIAVEEGVTLYFTGTDVRWLKLYSTDTYFTWIASFDGSMLIENVYISSWDPLRNDFDVEADLTGRSFILAKNSGRMDVIDSEISHLGYNNFLDRPRGYPFGGSYGLSWKMEDGTMHEKIMTGNVENSEIHHNRFGIYTYISIGQEMTNNYVHSNDQYGFDPHDDSSYLIIENNTSVNNGSHGIIISKRCVNNIIANNVSMNNALHGVMLDQSSDQNLVRGNELSGNEDGIVALDSHNNILIDNQISQNRGSGIRFNIMSSENIAIRNALRNNHKGVYVYEGSIDNHFIANDIIGNEYAVHLRGVTNNVLINNYANNNDVRIQINEQSLRNYVVFND